MSPQLTSRTSLLGAGRRNGRAFLGPHTCPITPLPRAIAGQRTRSQRHSALGGNRLTTLKHSLELENTSPKLARESEVLFPFMCKFFFY